MGRERGREGGRGEEEMQGRVWQGRMYISFLRLPSLGDGASGSVVTKCAPTQR